MAEHEQKLRDHPGDWMTLANPFASSVGHFWGIPDTRDYMRARYALVEALGKVNTRDAVQAQLDHLLDMLRLCRGDNMGVRCYVPHLMLRLNQDQECYDFVKWWSITAKKTSYDFHDLTLPYLDTKNANVFESPAYLCGRFASSGNLIAITLLKIKLLLDLTGLRDALRDYADVPADVVKVIQDHIPRSPIIVRLFKDTADITILETCIEDLSAQVTMLYKVSDPTRQCCGYWSVLRDLLISMFCFLALT